MKNIFLLVIIFFSEQLIAQKIHFGIGLGVANTFFHSTSNLPFDKNYFRTIPRRNIGISLYCIHDLSDKLAITTGIILQPKSYTFVQKKFDMPDVNGYMKITPKIFAFEIPFLISYNVKHLNEKYDLGFLIGPDFVLNSTTAITISSDLNLNSSTSGDTLFYDTFFSKNFSSIYSVDVHAAIKLTKKQDLHRKFELILSYQYGLMNTQKFNYETNLKTNQSGEKHFNAVFAPRLSYLSLRFIYYFKRKSK